MLSSHYFEAHEFLEVPWRESRNIRLQIAIWLAAAYVHWSRGNYSGAVRLFARIVDHPAAATLPILHELNVWLSQAQDGEPVLAWTHAAIGQVLEWGPGDS
jgi:hypothetical protein